MFICLSSFRKWNKNTNVSVWLFLTVSVLNISMVCSVTMSCWEITVSLSITHTHTHRQTGTHSDGLVQGSFVLPLELCSDLHQVDFTARNDDPGHHLLLRSFTLQRHRKTRWRTTNRRQRRRTDSRRCVQY